MELIAKIIERNLASEDIAFLLDMHPFDLMEIYEQLPSEDKTYLISLISEEKVAELLTYLSPEDAADFIQPLGVDKQQTLLNQIDPDDAADIIGELDEEESTALVESLGSENKAVALLKFEEDQAGSFMNNSFVVVNNDDGVKAATKKIIIAAGQYSSIQTIFVVDEAGKYIGQMPLKTLLKAKPPTIVSDILSHETTFKETDDIQEVVSYMKEFSDNDVPIINDLGILVGVITASDVLEMVHEEAIEDFAKMSALPDANLKLGVYKSAIKRLPWLLILLVMTLVIALITSNFEHVIQATVVLAFFQPLILDVGGDVASQSLAVTLVALHKEDSDLKHTGIKEVVSGLIVAISLSLVSFAITFAFGYFTSYSSPINLALVVSLSLILTVIIGFLFGFFVPLILSKLKLDPAVASGPFITTSIDILSLVIYFSLALLIL